VNREQLNQRLSQISTIWSVLHQAHQGSASAATAAQELLIQRYGGAVYRYLRGAVRDPDLADELTQEFALSLVRGEFRHVQPERGRFRNYVKTVLFHLVSKHHRRQKKQPRPLARNSPEWADLAAPAPEEGAAFDADWRAELLSRAWNALAQAQPVYYAVLRCRAEHPKMPSAQMAQELTRRLGKPLTPDGVRQTLHRARDRFAQLLLEAVAGSLETPTPEQVAEELGDLNLLEYCRPALERRERDCPPSPEEK
jgi:RNA polymerase sigma-70 factor (ECF subfamily)